jgi:hypothetical protein
MTSLKRRRRTDNTMTSLKRRRRTDNTMASLKRRRRTDNTMTSLKKEKKNRQYNGFSKKTINDLQNTTEKTKD